MPEISGQLVSVTGIENVGFTVIFKNEKVFVKSNKENIHLATRNKNGQYQCDFAPCSASVMTSVNTDGMLWHRRLGHPNKQVMKLMSLPTSEDFCDICPAAKQSVLPMGTGPRVKKTVPWKTVHSDLCGAHIARNPFKSKVFFYFH